MGPKNISLIYHFFDYVIIFTERVWFILLFFEAIVNIITIQTFDNRGQ